MGNMRIRSELRRRVYGRAGGRCEYCLMPESLTLGPHEVDHIVAQKHGGQATVDNLALSCTCCNKHKGSDLSSIDPSTGLVTLLYHPRRDHWENHSRSEGTRIVPLPPTGRATVRLLQLNTGERIAERQLAITAGLLAVD